MGEVWRNVAANEECGVRREDGGIKHAAQPRIALVPNIKTCGLRDFEFHRMRRV